MKVHLDPHTGQTVTPEAVPAYLAHPSNAGRVVQLVPMLTFSRLEHPQALAGETPGGDSSPLSPGATSHNHTHNQGGNL